MNNQFARVLFTIFVFALVLFTMWHSRMYRPSMDKVIIMDTVVTISYPGIKQKNVSQILVYMQRLSNMLDYYNKDSCLNKLNKEGKIDAGDECFDVLYEVLTMSKDAWSKSNGAFDPGYVNKLPIGRTHITRQKIVLAEGQVLDLSGIAKGFIVDKAVEKAVELGFPYVWINAGGEVKTYSQEGRNLLVGIRDPKHRTKAITHIYLKNESVATSGMYERGMHIVEPNGSALPSGIISASVVAKSCAVADAFATALIVKGKDFLDDLSRMGLPAMCIYVKDSSEREIANNLWKEKQV